LTYIADLGHYVAELRSLNVDAIQPQIDSLARLPLKLDQLRGQARRLYTQLNSMPGLRRRIQLRLGEFQRNLSVVVQETMDAGLTKFRSVFEKELQLAVIATWRDIPCDSLRIAVKRGVDSVCITALMPLNAFWAGLGLALLLFIPGIIFAVKLAGLYRKTEPYSSDYEEP
uniref:DUF4349 domain-containing protein n=1 Tax=Echinostoma caproni TaxID=27848 RepID=A0A183AWE7_9TREM